MESWPSLFVCRACPGWTPQPRCFGLVAVQVPLIVLTVSAEMPMEPFLGERAAFKMVTLLCGSIFGSVTNEGHICSEIECWAVLKSVLGTLSEVNICVSQRAKTKSLNLWEFLPALTGFSRLLCCLFPLGSLSLGAAAGPCTRCSEFVLLMRDLGKVAATEDGCILPHSGRPFLPLWSKGLQTQEAVWQRSLVNWFWDAGFLSGAVTACSEPPGLSPDLPHLLQD